MTELLAGQVEIVEVSRISQKMQNTVLDSSRDDVEILHFAGVLMQT